PPADLLFIGDSTLDQAAAQAAGIPFIAYKSELEGAERVEGFEELVGRIGNFEF
ncbi:MAG: HAD hydrolase-like protein, partial [Desulfuromonadales bacterium]|nr:HAD hydrolase-like protein [Desulfuromonadales bacterium]